MSVIYSFFLKDKHFLIRLVLCLCFLISMSMTYSLWLGERSFPKAPLFEFLQFHNVFFDLFLVIFFISVFIVFVLKPKPLIGLSVVFLYVIMASQDQNRLQPFFFELILAVLAMTLFSNDKKRVEQCLLLIFVGTYFWSGVHKANSDFFNKWMLAMNNRIPFVPEELRAMFTFSISILEASFGLLLISKFTRRYGVLLITLMHSIIVGTLLIEGFGYAVIPLTFFNVFTLIILFYNSKLTLRDVFRIDNKKTIAVFLFTIIFPVFNFFGFYDHLLSFSYFSGKPKYCRIWLLNNEDYEKLPEKYSQYINEWKGSYYVDLNYWSQESIGVGVYPEIRVYNQINKQFQELLGNSEATKIELY